MLRASYGMFYAKTQNSTYYAIRVENGVYQQTFNCTTKTCPTLTFPNVIFPAPGPTLTAPFAGALTPTVTTFAPPAATQLTHGLVPDFQNCILPNLYEWSSAPKMRPHVLLRLGQGTRFAVGRLRGCVRSTRMIRAATVRERFSPNGPPVS